METLVKYQMKIIKNQQSCKIDMKTVNLKHVQYQWIVNLEFDQLIWEFGNEDNPDWLHISYVDLEKNRKRILKAVRDQGKVKYINITNV